MIISHKYKFIFIKTAKTAGSSLEVFLSKVCGPDDVVTTLTPPEPGHIPRNYKGFFNPFPELFAGRFMTWKKALLDLRNRIRFHNHLPARLIRCRISNTVWSSYFKFCVERNPWDKTLSHYHMVRSTRTDDLSLDAYLHKGKFCLNTPIYLDWDERTPLVDRFIRYENLDKEFAIICSQLGIPFGGKLTEQSKAGLRKDSRNYREVFSPAQAKVIEKAFAHEIELHGYHF